MDHNAIAPLSKWPTRARQQIKGVFTDIDDTLTTDGAITADARQALGALQKAGLHVIPVTGRSTGWSAPFALSWPIDAIVAENGAVALQRVRPEWAQPSKGLKAGLSKTYRQSDEMRRVNFARMQQIAQRILKEVPQARLAADSSGRETDMAIDHSEFHHLPADAVVQVVAIMRSEGMQATVSSIHVNGWFGDHNKLDGARWAVRRLFGRELDAERTSWVFVGDSTNDELMFEYFEHSIGVANILRFLPALQHKPRYITAAARGTGFAEVAEALLSARAGQAPPNECLKSPP